MTAQSHPHHIPSIPYTSPATPLQTLDIWLPRPLAESSPTNTVWIIYVHGGAWRDPELTSSQLRPALAHLFPSPAFPPSASIAHIAGFASLNYRLSPYDSHPTFPSDPHDKSRNVRHPAHVRDVDAAFEWLGSTYGVGCGSAGGDAVEGDAGADGAARYEWVGIGHSCGATLLLQRLAGIGLGGVPASAHVRPPVALVLLEGIYDMPLLLRNHSQPGVKEMYVEILEGAFGTERDVWERASPVKGTYGRHEVRLILLGQSEEDELVEWEQVEAMEGVLKRQGWAGESEDEGERVIVVKKIKGTHDFVWEDGAQVAMLIEEVVRQLFR